MKTEKIQDQVLIRVMSKLWEQANLNYDETGKTFEDSEFTFEETINKIQDQLMNCYLEIERLRSE